MKKDKLVHISLIKWLQLKAPRGGQTEIMCLFTMTHWKECSITFEGISAWMHYASILIHVETADKPKLRNILENNWLALFKNIKVIDKVTELRKPSRLKKTRDMVIIKCCGILDWILGNQNKIKQFAIKDINGIIANIWMGYID